MIRHIVAWNLKDEFSADEKANHAAQFKKELEALAGVIPGLVYIQVNISPEDNSDRRIVLNSLFTSKSALSLYKDHPAHVKAGQFVRSVVTDRICLDFEE